MDTNFHQKRQEEQESTTTSANQTQALEFANGEEMLQHDREQNPPPPEIAERLNQSLAKEPKLGTSFWTRLGFKK
jgi:hypothetical protein